MDERDDERKRRDFEAFLAEVRWQRENPWWRPGAVRPEERERLVRVGLELVMGSRAGDVLIIRGSDDTITVGEQGHLFGFPIDTALGDDTRTVFEHDVEWLIDELCETSIAWAKRLPECPIHPDSHALEVTFTDSTATATCPVVGTWIRSVTFAAE